MEQEQYIYNLKQANYFVSQGARVIKIGIHKKTLKVFIVFYREDIERFKSSWLEYKSAYSKTNA